MSRIRPTRRGGVLRTFVRAVAIAAAAAFALIAYVYLTLPDVRVLAASNPERTAFMRLRAQEATAEGRPLRHVHQWMSYERISKNLVRAVLVAEDARFWEHDGVDLEEIRKSMEINMERGAAVRGASTITQQLAKNLYLSPSRDPLRKLRELIIARRMEAALPKARILELYLNLIEWGDGIWGADAAARTYFGVSASALGREQAALLAGAIINPRVLNPARPNARLRNRQRIILSRMGGVQPPAPAPIPVEPGLEIPYEFRSDTPDEELPRVPDVPEEDGVPEFPIPSEPLPDAQPEPLPESQPEPLPDARPETPPSTPPQPQPFPRPSPPPPSNALPPDSDV